MHYDLPDDCYTGKERGGGGGYGEGRDHIEPQWAEKT